MFKISNFLLDKDFKLAAWNIYLGLKEIRDKVSNDLGRMIYELRMAIKTNCKQEVYKNSGAEKYNKWN